jgi:hypothetical protein
MIVISLSSLYDEIAAMKDKDYETHFNDPKKNFADWVTSVTGEELFGANMRLAKDKGSALKVLEIKRDGKKMPEVKPAAPGAPVAVPPGVSPAAPAPGTQPTATPVSAVPSSVAPVATPTPAATVEPSTPQPAAMSPSAPISAPAAPAAPSATPSVPPPTLEQMAANKETMSRLQEQLNTSAASRRKSRLEKLVARPEASLKLENGIEISSLTALKDYLPKMDDALFAKYVTDKETKFAQWVRDSLHDDEWANEILKAKTKSDLIAMLT